LETSKAVEPRRAAVMRGPAFRVGAATAGGSAGVMKGRARAILLAALVQLGGCGKATSPPISKEPATPPCVTRDPGPSPLRRLTRREYRASVNFLLGAAAVDASVLPADERALGFDNNAEVMSVSALLVQTYMDLAEQSGDFVAANL
jgi:Protein of unknown function (DUF1587)